LGSRVSFTGDGGALIGNDLLLCSDDDGTMFQVPQFTCFTGTKVQILTVKLLLLTGK
jgi:hypothetical protein